MNGTPEGFNSISPYMIFSNAAEAIEFYKHAFGAAEIIRMTKSDGKIMHAELQIGTSQIMLVDETPDFSDMKSPKSIGGSPMHIHMYVGDVDASIQQAVAAGARLLMPARDSDDGERRGGIEDPFGFTWWLATQKVARSRAELQQQFDDKQKA